MAGLESRNPNLAASRASLASAKATLDSASALFWPTLSVSASSQTGAAGSAPTVDSYKAGLSASWEIDLWGKASLGAASGELGERAAMHDYASALLSARASLASAWVSARSLQKQAKFAALSSERLAAMAEIAQARAELGAATPAEADSARSALLSSQADAEQTALSLGQAERSIAQACGLSAGSFKMPEPAWAQMPELGAASSVPAKLLERRPDLLAAKARLYAADATRAQSDAALLPTLSISANASSQASALAGLFAAGANSWSIAPALAASLFDGGVKKAAQAQSEAGYAKALAAYRVSALGALGEAEDALDQARRAQAEASLRDKAAALASKSAQSARDQYREGAISGYDLQNSLAAEISAMRQAFDARTRLLQSQLAIARTFAGSIWNASEPQPEASLLQRQLARERPQPALAEPGAALPGRSASESTGKLPRH
jgi:NodT family efflux transporter outer membrane factor (OMF) lipoprotein